MTMTGEYFFDTYALVEILNGNRNYAPFALTEGTTGMLNLAELAVYLKKRMEPSKADEFLEKLSVSSAQMSLEDIKAASSLKLKYRDLSLADAIGYCMAERMGLKFLTGDNDFEKMPNVEYIKK
ncbi:MAG: PIN domain-containing protein [Candidatus Micrarchaeota archaeon]